MKTPAMIPGSVEMVSVEWIMQNATNSVDHYGDNYGGVDYEKMVRNKGTDYNFGYLVSAIIDYGFRVPIVLVKNYTSYNGHAEEFGDVVHGNGHHRMVAAILLCLDEIPVFWSEGRKYMCEEYSETEEVPCHDDSWEDFENFLAKVLKEDHKDG